MNRVLRGPSGRTPRRHYYEEADVDVLECSAALPSCPCLDRVRRR